jgi:hypothetical protein
MSFTPHFITVASASPVWPQERRPCASSWLAISWRPEASLGSAYWLGLHWRHVWSGLAMAGFPPLLIDAGFSAIHNILPLQSRRHRLRLAPSPACLRCGAPTEDVLHFFTQCPRVADAWEVLALASTRALCGPLPDLHLLLLNLPIHPNEQAVVLAVLAHIELAWRLRDLPDPIPPQQLVARLLPLPMTIFDLFSTSKSLSPPQNHLARKRLLISLGNYILVFIF